MTDTPEHLAERLNDEGQKALEFFRSLSPADWEKQVYTEGARWQLRQVLAHFVSSEIALVLLVKDILAGGPGSPEDLNLDEYNERRVNKLGGVSIEDLLARFADGRRQTIELVAQMRAPDLQRTGRHPFLGIASLEDIIKMIYRHNQIHLREIRKIISTPGP